MGSVAWARIQGIFRQRCPRCLNGRVFPPGTWHETRMYYACPVCRVVYGREEGYFTGAMIVSYVLGVPLLALQCIPIAVISGWRFELALLVAVLYFLPFAPAIFRYSRVIWMHFDRLVDPNLESERYVPARRAPTANSQLTN